MSSNKSLIRNQSVKQHFNEMKTMLRYDSIRIEAECVCPTVHCLGRRVMNLKTQPPLTLGTLTQIKFDTEKTPDTHTNTHTSHGCRSPCCWFSHVMTANRRKEAVRHSTFNKLWPNPSNRFTHLFSVAQRYSSHHYSTDRRRHEAMHDQEKVALLCVREKMTNWFFYFCHPHTHHCSTTYNPVKCCVKERACVFLQEQDKLRWFESLYSKLKREINNWPVVLYEHPDFEISQLKWTWHELHSHTVRPATQFQPKI